MNAQEMQNKFNEMNFEDEKVLELTSQYFGDEVIVRITYFKDEAIVTFLGCDRVEIQHWWGTKFKPIKEYTRQQLGYFAHSIKIIEVKKESCSYKRVKINGEIKNIKIDSPIYYECIWDLGELTLIVFCRDIKINVEHK